VTAGFAAAPSDGRHVFAIPAHGDAALSARVACLARIEFVCGPLGVGRASTLARDLALLLTIHRSETAVASAARLSGSALW
jgi:hypothetical protein